MTSVLDSNYIPPSRPYSNNELSDIRENFFKKLYLSNIKAVHKNCNHFYFVKENGRKEKELIENNDNVGNCSCCWKFSKTPDFLVDKAKQLIDIYYDNFVVQPEHLTYTLLDIEMSYYKWLYVDKYDVNKNFKKRV